MSARKENFEKNIERLQYIVEQLETGGLPLDKGVALYKEGQALAASCRKQLEQTRLAVSVAGPDGPAPFAPDSGEEM